MTEKQIEKKDSVKRETFMIGVFIALCAGFAGGFAYGVHQAASPIPGMPHANEQVSKEGHSEQFHRMIDALESKIAENPEDVGALIQLGNIYFDDHQFEKAVQTYEKALEIKPDNPDVLTDLGVMYRRSGNPEKAMEAFSKAVAVDPTHQIAMYNKGVVQMHDLNDIKGAVQSWKRLEAINPEAKSPDGVVIGELIKAAEAETTQQK